MSHHALPEVIGDPAGMRALASRLRADADRVRSLTQSADGLVHSAKMKGPAANGIRARARGAHGGVGKVAGRLHDLADFLEHQAADVERRQHARDLHNARLEQENHGRGGRR
jgi:hypothetical protein